MLLKFEEHILLSISADGQLKLFEEENFDLMNTFSYKVGFKSVALTKSKNLIFLGLSNGNLLIIR